MMHSLAPLAAGALLAAFAPQEAPEETPDAVAEFEAICLSSRAARDGIEALALARGYAPAEATQEEEAGSHRADPPPRVWSRGEGDAEMRVASAPGRMRMSGPWQRVNRCYVDGPGDYPTARDAAGRLAGVGSFRQRDTVVFAWTEEEAGERRGVRQSQFERNVIPLLRDRGLQIMLVSRTPDGVTLSYVVAAPPDSSTAE